MKKGNFKNRDENFIKTLNQRFIYDPETGDFFWRDGIRKGEKAGYLSGVMRIRKYDGKKYQIIVLDIKGHTISAHRAAWAMYYGYFPEKVIDHIDNNPLNNRIDNLRAVTYSENSMNRTMPCGRNSHGLKNIHVYTDRKKMYGVVIRGNNSKGKGSGLQIRKQFYTLKEAIIFRNKELKKLGLPHKNIDANEWLTGQKVEAKQYKNRKVTKYVSLAHKKKNLENKIKNAVNSRRYSRQELSELFNICYSTVCAIIKSNGLESKIINGNSRDHSELLEAARTGNYTLRELSKKFNLSYHRTSTILVRNQVKAKRQKKKQ